MGKPGVVGTLLLCKRSNRYWFGDIKYYGTNRIPTYKNQNDENPPKTTVTLKYHGILKSAKWVRITISVKVNDEWKNKWLEIRDGSGWFNSSGKVHHLLNYFSDVLERPRCNVWGQKVVPNEYTDSGKCEKCTSQLNNHVVPCTWKCYRNKA